jgi:ribosome biogenesis GTPase / thiamine phosphate phosphatase
MNEDVPSLEAIGFDDFFQAQLDKLDGGLVPARIAIAHGESYVSWTRDGVRKAVLSGSRIGGWKTAAERPQVGDWVAGTYEDTAGALVIEHLLERRTCLVRRAAGASGEAQIIASNVDVVGVVSAFGDGEETARDRRLINEGRLRRYLAAIEQSGASPLFIVNKSDLSAAPEQIGDNLRQLFPGVPVVLVSGARGAGLEQLHNWIRPRQTLVLVGMSGVGKSTLVNVILGRQAQETGEVRVADARGRHTTAHRELFVTDSGALLLDTPGMRELQLWEVAGGLAGAFADVEEIEARCRFSDCGHDGEPGCAIRAALADGSLDRERWESYSKLQRELHWLEVRQNARLGAEERKKRRAFARSMRKVSY